MSSPQRHGPAQYVGDQRLHLPQELVDMIEANLQGNDRKAAILKLRLSCPTFAHGLSHAFYKSCLHDFVMYLDEKGIEDIEWLANSPLAPFVQNVRFADRVTSLRVLEFREVNEETKLENLDTIDYRVAKMAEWQSKHGKPLIFTQPDPECPEGDVLLGKAHECRRNDRHRADYNKLYLGYSVTEKMMDCAEVKTLDLRPSIESTRRLAAALRKFPNVTSISTSRELQVLAQSRDLRDQLLDGTIIHGNDDVKDGLDYRRSRTKCVCAPRGRRHLRCTHIGDDVIWPAVADIGLLTPMLPLDVSIFTTITTLSLNFYTKIAIDAARTDIQDHASSVAVFISSCTALKSLSLCAEKRLADSQGIAAGIDMVVRSLTPLPKLRHLRIDHIEPTTPRCVDYLAKHVAHLESLSMPACLLPSTASNDIRYVRQWGALLIAISSSESLDHLHLGFRKHRGLSRAESHVEYLVQSLVGRDGTARARTARFGRAFECWVGDMKYLEGIRI